MDVPQEPRCRDAGISHFEYQVLALLSEAPGRTLRMSALATWAGASLPRLSQVVSRLEQRGWIRRTPDPADGRYTLATLTSHGQAKATQAAPGHVEEVRRLVFDPLTKTQTRQLRGCSSKLALAGWSCSPALSRAPGPGSPVLNCQEHHRDLRPRGRS